MAMMSILMMRRQGMYKAEEQEADHKCKIGRGK